MNNIYKVIWSKAKNCYVVASEIAKSHTKSASGQSVRRSALASLLALSLLCGGWGAASASLEVVDQSGTAGTVTIYTKDEVDHALTAKGAATDVAKNTADIAANKDNINKLETNKLDKDVANSTFATKDALNDLTTTVNDKVDESVVEAALEGKADKADTLAGYGIKDAYTKGDVDNKLNEKADAANVFTKDQTYTRDQVNTKLADYAKTTDVNTALAGKANVGDSYTKAEADGQITTAKNELGDKITANTTKIDANKTAIDDLKTKAATTENTLTNLSGRMAAAESDIDGLQADMATAKSDIGTLKADVSTAKSDINSLKTKDTELTGKIEAEIANRITSDTALDHKIDAEIANRITSDTALDHKIEAEIANRITSDTALDNKIDAEIANRITSDTALDHKIDTEIQDRKDAIKATNDRTGGIARNLEGTQTTIEGIVKVDNQGNVKDVKGLSAETITTTGDAAIGGTLGVTGATTLNGALTANGEATFKDKVSVEKDLTVNGKLNVGEIYLKNDKLESTGKKHDSATSITADGISNLAKVTEHGNTTESQFTHNEKGTFNHAKDGTTTDWKESTSNVTADGVANVAKDSKGNNNTFTQTSTDTKNILTDKDGNTSTTRQDGKGIYGYAKDKDGNKSYTKQEGNRIAESVIGKDGTETKSEMTSTDITNTAKDGTITNDAKDIVNNATGDMTNTVGGNLTTTVGGNEIHDVKGTKTETVEGKVTENFKGGQETNVTGDQTTNVSGTQTTNATDINRNASSSMVDKVDNAYGTNTETKEAGKTTTDVSIKGTGEKGQYIRGANESRDYLIKGTLTNTETKTAEATSSEITDGANTASTRQDAKNLAGSVTNGTEIGVSGIHANDDGSVSIDSAVAGGGMSSVINQKKDSIQSAVGDGTNSTVIHQDKDNVTIASSNGTVAIVGKDIVNNASESITNKAKTMDTTVTGKATESYGELDTTVNGMEKHTVNGNQDIHVTGKQTNTVEGGQENIISGGQTNTITGGQINNITGDQTTTITGNKTETVTENVTEDYKKNLTTTVGGNEIHEVKGTKTETVEGKVIENFKGGQETNVTGNQDIHVTGKQTNKIDGNQENTIGGDQTTNVTGDISNTAKNITNAATDTLTDKVGENTRVITSRSITDTVGAANRMIEDGKITDNAGDFTVTTDKENGTTFTNAGSTASSFTTVDGTNTGSAQEWTNIKGNEISTGKVVANYVKMDYADVMHDLGVHGSATVDNDLTVKGITTTKTLKVTENATVGGTLDVTKKATFHDDVDITKNLSVGGNATITGDVTAKSYKVGDKTYISADGINANNQKITNVADGSISEGSKDAVNGGQLYGVKRDLEHQVDKVGANAAAMANLRPMEFDPDSKWNIAAAIGNYGSETAAALGAFYRPNDDVMVNLSTAFGTGENMVGGGVSVRLGKGGNKLSREETNALKAQVADLTARMDALLSVLNPNMSKDFPDVPENHWAYEAVSRLAGNDIVQGYPDGEFHGERTMTRYEMAEIIYNALSRGAEAEKELVEEFKPELQAMAASEKATAEKAEG